MLNSDAKLSTSLLLAVAALTLPSSGRVVAICLPIALMAFHPSFRPYSRKARAFVLAFARYAVTITVVVLAVNGLIVSNDDVTRWIGPVRVSVTGFNSGIDIVSRLVLLSVSAVLFFGSTSMRTFALFLEQSRLPSQITGIILLSIHFVEEIPGRILTIHAAQESRGAALRGSVVARGRALVTILGPLVLASMVESIERGVTLQLRGFFQHRHSGRTVEASTFSSRIWTILCLAAACGLIAWRVMNG